MSQAASAECYENTQKTVSDVAPVRWFLHDAVEPEDYLVFTDMYHGFENCTLSNMVYNDDFNVCIDVVNQDGTCTTPLIPTDTVMTTGAGASGIEVSLLDRNRSENITKTFSYRQGVGSGGMSSWTEVEDPIGGVLSLNSPYVQFKIDVTGVLRVIDYEFMGIAIRPYTSINDWTRTSGESIGETTYLELIGGECTLDDTFPAELESYAVEFEGDGALHRCAWHVYVPPLFATQDPLTLRMMFLSVASGTAKVDLEFQAMAETSIVTATNSTQIDVVFASPGLSIEIVDLDISSYISATDTHLMIIMERDSSVIGDTLAGDLSFIAGRAVEI
jgi:hypothetical protein